MRELQLWTIDIIGAFHPYQPRTIYPLPESIIRLEYECILIGPRQKHLPNLIIPLLYKLFHSILDQIISR